MKNLSIILIVGAMAVTGACSGASNPLCEPVNNWHAPAHRCAAPQAAVEEEVEEEPEEVVPLEASEPMVKVSDDKIEILQKVQFETGSDEIRSVSFSLLDEVASTLNDNPDITKVSVEGHTDTVGSASLNRRLSKGRAKSVMRYLVGQGVDAARLEAQGYGPDQPIADNESDSGREQNRRVEFKILSRE
tara:strand:- start:14981 stop:15547 length:567 start_codon:yes stop_codon:yes gene_type:complete